MSVLYVRRGEVMFGFLTRHKNDRKDLLTEVDAAIDEKNKAEVEKVKQANDAVDKLIELFETKGISGIFYEASRVRRGNGRS